MLRLFLRALGPLFVLAILVTPLVMMPRFLRRVRLGQQRIISATWRYGAVILAPTVLFVLVGLGLVGLEELTGAALVPEELGRGSLLIVALGLIIFLLFEFVFVVAAWWVGRPVAARSLD